MAEGKRLVIFGDSIAKGVTYQDGRYHLCSEHNFDALAQKGIAVSNFAKMGACSDTVLAIAKKRLDACEGAQVILSFGGNDCDFDWQAVSDHPEEAHLPKIAAETFAENYRALVKLLRQAGSSVWMTSLVPLEAHRFLNHVSQGRSKENILSWLGDAAHLYRWQEYYNALTVQMARAFGCRLVDLRTAFLQSRNFLDLLCPDGIHPTDSGYALAHKTLSAAMY